MKFFGKKTPGTKGTGRIGAAVDIAEAVHGSSDGGEKNQKSEAPAVSEKTKSSAGFLKKTVTKIGDVLHKKFGSTIHTTDTASMSNEEYLGEIYKIMVQNRDDAKLEREEQVNHRKEEDSEDQKRHEEIIKALTLRRRPKPKRVQRREKKAEDKEKAAKDKERADKEKAAKDKEKAAKDKAAQDKADKDKAAQDKANKDKAAKDKADKEKADREKAAKDKADKEKADKEKADREKAEKERVDREKAAAEKDRAEKERIQREREAARKEKEEALKKEKEAKTEAEKRAAQQEKEQAQKKIDDAKAAEEARKKALEESKKKALEEAKKKAAEEEKKKLAEEAKKKAEEEAKKKAEEKAKKLAEEKAKKEAEEKAKKEAEEKARKLAEEKAKKAAEEKAKKEAEEKAKKEAEEKLKKETAEKLKKEQQEKAKKEAEEKLRLEKLKKEQKPETATQQPPAQAPKPGVSTAQKIALGAAPVIIGGLLMPSNSVAGAIDKASSLVGVSRPLMYAMANQESQFNPNIKADTTSATGLYQFLESSWGDMVKKYGKQYPILKERGVKDPEANAIAGALYIRDNAEVLKKAGIPVNASTIYTAHFLGAGGARSFFKLNDDDIAAKRLPAPAEKNPWVFYNLKKNAKGKNVPDLDSPKTVRQIKEFLFQKVGQYEDKYAKGLENITVTSTSGTQVNNSSIQNKDMKSTPNQSGGSGVNVNVNNVNNNTASNPPKVDDRPAHERKK